jgi:carotenoid cleavage dioxygenase-like enzyme
MRYAGGCCVCAAGGGDYSKMRHMFDGYGFLSRLRLAGGRAWGSQRYVQSKAYKAYRAQGELVGWTASGWAMLSQWAML